MFWGLYAGLPWHVNLSGVLLLTASDLEGSRLLLWSTASPLLGNFVWNGAVVVIRKLMSYLMCSWWWHRFCVLLWRNFFWTENNLPGLRLYLCSLGFGFFFFLKFHLFAIYLELTWLSTGCLFTCMAAMSAS